MKKSALLWALGLGLFAGPAALSARHLDQVYADQYLGRTDTPIPKAVVRPKVSLDYVGTEVQLVFVVNELGRPSGIRSRSRVPSDLFKSLAVAVAQWRFEPLRDAKGEPVAAKVLLPVRITKEQREDRPLIARLETAERHE